MTASSRTRWEDAEVADYVSPHWARAVMLVVDLQNDFLDDGVAAISGTSAVVGKIAELAAAFRESGRPLAHVIRLYERGGSDVDLCRRDSIERGVEVVAPGSAGSQIAAPVVPPGTVLEPRVLLAGGPQRLGDREVVFYKPRWSAFHRTGLEDWLRECDCDTVVVVGCNLPNCPRATLFDASVRDFRTVLVSDAVSGVTEERVADLTGIGTRIVSTSEVLDALAGVPR